MIVMIHSGGTFVFPVTPTTFGPSGGNAIYDDVRVLQLGTVPFFGGTELREYSWSSFFPKNKASYTEGDSVPDPLAAKSLLATIKNSGEVVTLLIPDLNINQKVQLRTFDYYQEKPGDIEYSITFVQHREIQVGNKRPS